jgi:hypothetical protein
VAEALAEIIIIWEVMEVMVQLDKLAVVAEVVVDMQIIQALEVRVEEDHTDLVLLEVQAEVAETILDKVVVQQQLGLDKEVQAAEEEIILELVELEIH